MDKLNDARQAVGISTLNANQLNKDKKIFLDSVADAKKSVDTYKESIEGLNKTIGETFGRIAEQVSKIPKIKSDTLSEILVVLAALVLLQQQQVAMY